MPDPYPELMAVLSQPRPNGSKAEQKTLKMLCSWLDSRNIPFRIQAFKRYPYFFESVGIWLVVSRLLLAAAVWMNLGWTAFVVALVGLAGGLVDLVFNLPLITWPGADTGKNLLIEIQPAEPRQEIVFCAHYDSKTEPLDHNQRMILLKLIPTGILLTLLLGISAVVTRMLIAQGLPMGNVLFWVNVALSLPLLVISLGLGINLSTGRLLAPSCGAVDNGAACAILLGFAERLSHSVELPREVRELLAETRLTIALFTAEEANMQGSRSFVRNLKCELPLLAINLEVMAQNADYVCWQSDGTIFHQMQSDGKLNDLLTGAVQKITGQPPLAAGPLTSDGGSFLSAGIPATTLGTKDRVLGWSGFHSPQDNLGRVVPGRIEEGIEILLQVLTGLHNTGYIKSTRLTAENRD